VTPVLTEAREVAASLCEAASSGTDLVVMATHARGPLGRCWHGSVADVLMRRLTVPLLLVRGGEEPPNLTFKPSLRRILIPLDGSGAAEQVLEPAIALGSLTGTDLTLLQVVRPAPDYSLRVDGGAARQRINAIRRAVEGAYLRRVARRVGDRTLGVYPHVVLDDRPPARAILHYAARHEADLIALATSGRGGLSRLFRGSVAERVIRGTSVPVLVVRAEATKRNTE
jgi:nucleotide-binding universal stress UspA family protein